MRKVILFTLAALSISGCKKKEELPPPSQETCSSEWMSQNLSKFTIEQQNHFRKACKAISEDQTIKQAPKATPEATTGVSPASIEKTPTKTVETKPEENVKPTTTTLSSHVPAAPKTTDHQGKVTAPIASSASTPSTK
ncbi:MAG: entry exclusion lipoprotein TrbK [Acetobacter sp.]|nr:entry exclusion lipoprotein TrbK [Acetobacter sp.]